MERDPNERNIFIFRVDENDGSAFIKANSVIKLVSEYGNFTVKAVANDYIASEFSNDKIELAAQENNENKHKFQNDYYMNLDKMTTDLDCFNLYKPESNYIIEMNFLMQIYPILVKILDTLSKEKDKKLKYRLRKYETESVVLGIIIDELTVFTQNKSLFSTPDVEWGQTNKFRQKSIRELYILSALMEIVKLQLPENEIDMIYTLYLKKEQRSQAGSEIPNTVSKSFVQSGIEKHENYNSDEQAEFCAQ